MKTVKKKPALAQDEPSTKPDITPAAISNEGLPDGWRWVKLGDVCERITKGGTPTTFGYKFQKNGVRFLKIENVKEGRVLLDSISDFISEEAHEFQKKSQLSVGDILFSIAGTIGETCAVREEYLPANTNQAFAIIRGAQSHFDLKFLQFQLESFVARIKVKARGGAMNNVSLEDIKNFEAILPPLELQHAIVSKIEELLSELDKGKQQLETAQQQLKIYRQAVFNLAIKGEANIPIEAVIDTLDQGWSPKCYNEPSRNSNEWGVIKTTAVQSGYFLDQENKRLPENLEPRKQHELKRGDLLITRAGPRVRVGVCCMVRETRPKLLNCDKVYRMRINSSIAIPEYIELLLNTPKYSKEIEKMKTGISDSGVNLTQKGFLKILLPIPTLEEQKSIVQEIESRLSVCDKVEETITTSLAQAETLRQSILKKAFEGKLA